MKICSHTFFTLSKLMKSTYKLTKYINLNNTRMFFLTHNIIILKNINITHSCLETFFTLFFFTGYDSCKPTQQDNLLSLLCLSSGSLLQNIAESDAIPGEFLMSQRRVTHFCFTELRQCCVLRLLLNFLTELKLVFLIIKWINSNMERINFTLFETVKYSIKGM
jgi:hypothetical protein